MTASAPANLPAINTGSSNDGSNRTRQSKRRFVVPADRHAPARGGLEEEGAVERKQGKTTYVAGKRVRHGLDALRSFHDSLVPQGLKPEMRVLSLERVDVPAHLRSSFVGADKGCVLQRRLHFVDGRPIAVGASYLPEPEVRCS
jgi:GntR family transcriptional regulator